MPGRGRERRGGESRDRIGRLHERQRISGAGCAARGENGAKRRAFTAQRRMQGRTVWCAVGTLQVRIGMRKRSELRNQQRKRENDC